MDYTGNKHKSVVVIPSPFFDLQALILQVQQRVQSHHWTGQGFVPNDGDDDGGGVLMITSR